MIKIFSDLSAPLALPQNTSVAIGFFDGVHLAHQAVLAQSVAGREQGLAPAVFTFRTEGRDGFKGAPMLTTDKQKLKLFEGLGVELVFFPYLSDLRELSPQEFVQTILQERCAAKRVCCGFDFHFGKGGTADAAQMQQLCQSHGIEPCIVPGILREGRPVSSTWIRGLVRDGQIQKANELLGRPFSFALHVRHGRKLGRTIGVPTINQHLPPGFVQPKFGVYISRILLGGQAFFAVTNIGVKPTVGSEHVVSESFLFDFQGDLYGKRAEVQLLEFLRPERKFANLSALRQQIELDQRAARRWIAQSL